MSGTNGSGVLSKRADHSFLYIIRREFLYASHGLFPKRAARMAAKLPGAHGGTTKAHEAVRVQVEANAVMRRVQTKAAREAAAAYKRDIARAKAKALHRGH
jgi:hypothetical protein